jgi:hypothetical protein
MAKIRRRRKVSIKRLKEVENRLVRKLADPKDYDDPKWAQRMLAGVEKRISKKEKSAEHKQRQKKAGLNRGSKAT